MTTRKGLTIGTLALFSLLLILTVPLYAKRDFGGNCLSCHTNGGISIASNTSETLVVSPSESFDLEITVHGDTEDLTVIWPGVSNNPSFGISPSMVVDDEPGDENSAEGRIRRTFKITAPATQGEYTIRVLAAGRGAMGGEMSCVVVVKEVPVPGENLVPAPYYLHTRSGMTVKLLDRSWDPDGNITSWHWEFGDGSNLTWFNHCNLTEEDSYDKCNPTTENECSLHGDSCNVSEGEHCGLTTEEGGSNCNAMGEIINHTFHKPGTYVVSLTVTDNRGGTSMYSAAIEVPGKTELLRLWTLQVFLASTLMVCTTVFVTRAVASNGKPKKTEGGS